MQSPTQHLMPKIPVFNRNAGCISENCGSIYSNTPLIRALLKDGPQFKTHSAWMVTLDSFPFTSTTAGLPLFTVLEYMKFLNHATHKLNTHTYMCNNLWALDLWTQTYPKGILVHLYNHINTFIILLAKAYIVYLLNIRILDNSRLLRLNLHT